MLNIILGIFGIIGYLYLNWRTLKENYREEDVVAFSWVALFIFIFVGRISYGLINWGIWGDKPWSWFEFWKIKEINLLGAYLAWFLFTFLIVRDKNWKLWSFMEDSLVSVWVLLVSIGIMMMNWKLLMALGVAGLVSVLMGKKYRSFVWYKSGKKGFLYFWFSIFFWVAAAIAFQWWYLLGVSLIFGVGLFMLSNDKFSK